MIPGAIKLLYLTLGDMATASVLTSVKKRKQIISPIKVNFAVRGGQLWIKTPLNSPEIL